MIFISLCLFFVTVACANLEGPFLFFGLDCLANFKKPIFKFVNQDELMALYSKPCSIIVFNNQDSVPLSSGAFPRLRKMLERTPMMHLTQDFLDVHPDYLKNETTEILLQGPWSYRDAQMTESFQRLQDVFGKGNVLGILGNSVSQSESDSERESDMEEESENEFMWRRKREATEDAETTTPLDERPARAQPRYALLNATGPPGNSILMNSSWPELRWPDGTITVLDQPIGQPTVKTSRLYTILVARFADVNTTNKITLEFSFKQTQGWWLAGGVEVKKHLEPSGLSLQAPPMPDTPSAVLGRSYYCSLPLVYSSDESPAKLLLRDVQMQPYMDSTEHFADSFDCIGFFTVPIWSGLMVSFLCLFIMAIAICMILDIKTMDKFETNRSKQLTITVSD